VIFELPEELPLDEAIFDDGVDPKAKEKQLEHQLDKLDYADVEIVIGGEPQKSAALFEKREYPAVLTFLRGKRDPNADECNDLGCAQAWKHDWAKAKASLERSKEKAGEELEKAVRAERNLAVAAKAKEVAES